MEDYMKRVVEEKTALDEKLRSLELFFATKAFHGLTPAQKGRLEKQSSIMKQYSDILFERIEAYERE